MSLLELDPFNGAQFLTGSLRSKGLSRCVDRSTSVLGPTSFRQIWPSLLPVVYAILADFWLLLLSLLIFCVLITRHWMIIYIQADTRLVHQKLPRARLYMGSYISRRPTPASGPGELAHIDEWLFSTWWFDPTGVYYTIFTSSLLFSSYGLYKLIKVGLRSPFLSHPHHSHPHIHRPGRELWPFYSACYLLKNPYNASNRTSPLLFSLYPFAPSLTAFVIMTSGQEMKNCSSTHPRPIHVTIFFLRNKISVEHAFQCLGRWSDRLVEKSRGGSWL